MQEKIEFFFLAKKRNAKAKFHEKQNPPNETLAFRPLRSRNAGAVQKQETTESSAVLTAPRRNRGKSATRTLPNDNPFAAGKESSPAFDRPQRKPKISDPSRMPALLERSPKNTPSNTLSDLSSFDWA